MERVVQPEILDTLSPEDPRVENARRDLRWINALMNHSRILQATIFPNLPKNVKLKVLEIGSGDGSLALNSFQKLGKVPEGSKIDFVDKGSEPSAKVKSRFNELGWEVSGISMDIFQWLKLDEHGYQICFSSLFLHHFQSIELSCLFREISRKISSFVCLEPRRNQFGLLGATGLRLLNCDSITLHDSKVSVRAGFNRTELTDLWNESAEGDWKIQEGRAGLFSHLFSASTLRANNS